MDLLIPVWLITALFLVGGIGLIAWSLIQEAEAAAWDHTSHSPQENSCSASSALRLRSTVSCTEFFKHNSRSLSGYLI